MNCILLLMKRAYNRELLADWLSQHYTVVFADSESSAPFDVPHDVCLVDEAMLAHFQSQVRAVRSARHPEFVPVVLLTAQPDMGLVKAQLWQTIDEIIRIPIEKLELQARLEILLRMRRLTQESLKTAQLVAERKQLEEQIRYAQRMESVGLLVSGVAHDFNNVLAGIKGHVQRGIGQFETTHPGYSTLQQIEQRVDQGARMVRQLLSFARGQANTFTTVNMNILVQQLAELLATSVGSAITFQVNTFSEDVYVHANPTQLEQVIMNLCLNARDAMPDGGVLTISLHTGNTANVIHSFPPEFTAEEYLCLSVSDTGTGMSEEVSSRLFEPFFTTKGDGKGTGLGLAVVARIIKEHHAAIHLESDPGNGTTFLIYFPLLHHKAPSLSPVEKISHGTSSLKDTPSLDVPARQMNAPAILIVEDDADLQMLMEMVLQEEGYTVFIARDGLEGLHMGEIHHEYLALIISDITIPKVNGKMFLERIKSICPDSKILVMSGHQEIYLVHSDLLPPHTPFLQKPFDLDELIRRVHALIPAERGVRTSS